MHHIVLVFCPFSLGMLKLSWLLHIPSTLLFLGHCCKIAFIEGALNGFIVGCYVRNFIFLFSEYSTNRCNQKNVKFL